VVWVLHYFHLFLHPPDPLILGRLRGIIEFSRFTDTVIMVGGADFNLPDELADIPVLRSQRPDRRELGEIFDFGLPPEEKEKAILACSGMSPREIEHLIALALVRFGKIDHRGLEELRAEWLESRSGEVLIVEHPRGDFNQIGGLKPLKNWLSVRGRVFCNPRAASEAGLTSPKGVLLTGVPGCGKSLLVQCLAKEWGLPLFRLDPSRIYRSGVGESERRIQQALTTVIQYAPCLLWIDELEKIFPRTDSRTDGGVSHRILGAFLHFLQDRSAPVFLAATANDPTALPPKFVRKGRWDEIFFIDLPCREEREEIFKILLEGRRLDLPLETEWIESTDGFSGAEIHQAFEDAGYESFYRGVKLSSLGLLKAIRETRPLSCLMKEKIEAMRTWGLFHARPANRTGVQSGSPSSGRVKQFTQRGRER
jgi:hypothetical protein